MVTADSVSRRDLLRIGVSSCLLGEQVRYDGGHKRHALLIEILGPQVEWVPVCPEFEMGLGVPREPLQLECNAGGARLVAIESRVDHTEKMRQWSAKRFDELARGGISGYVLKSRSPSCGMGSVSVRGEPGPGGEAGSGLFAEALHRRLPNLPVEEETAFTNATSVEHFLERAREYDQRRIAGPPYS